MPSWVLTISDAEPPKAGIFKALDKNGSTVVVHHFRKSGGNGLFIYAGAAGRHVRGYGTYPHVTLMIDGALHQKGGLLFFRCSTLHVSLSESWKLFFSVVDGRFVPDGGQNVVGRAEMIDMVATVNSILRPDITGGITGGRLDDAFYRLRPSDLPPWEREALEKQEFESRMWALQFEWPEDDDM